MPHIERVCESSVIAPVVVRIESPRRKQDDSLGLEFGFGGVKKDQGIEIEGYLQ